MPSMSMAGLTLILVDKTAKQSSVQNMPINAAEIKLNWVASIKLVCQVPTQLVLGTEKMKALITSIKLFGLQI